MPIEIRELIIRATVREEGEATGAAGAPRRGAAPAWPRAEALPANEFDRIVEACVRRLARVMRRSGER